jgi:surfactin family lipopeptide synthetase A
MYTRTETSLTHTTSAQLAPLSFEQQQVWFLSQLMPDLPICTKGIILGLPGPLAPEALEQSLNEIIRRHEIWRTSFPFLDESPVHVVHAPPSLPLPVVDLRSLSQAEREEAFLRRTREAVRLPFDLAQGPLLRAILFRIDDADHRLCLTIHSIIADDISLSQIFLSELHTLYTAFVSGQSSPLPDLVIQYRDVAVEQRERFQRSEFVEHLAYWKQQLANAPAALELPTDRPRPPVPSAPGAMIPFALSASLTEALRAFSRQVEGTLSVLLLAALSALLFRYTGQEDVLIGTPSEGRFRAAERSLLGTFMRPLVIRTSPSGSQSFHDLLKQVQQVMHDAQTHQEVPFELLVNELHSPSHLGQTPLFQVFLALEPSPPLLPSGWTAMMLQPETSLFDLSLIIEDRPDGLAGRFVYRTDLFDTETIARMVGHWQTLLEGIMADPTQCLAKLPLLTEKERHQLLAEWNATQAAYPKDKCIHQLFEAQVECTPEAVAVVFEGEQLTYRELNRRANQLAHYLQHLGVGPDVLVGICVERSLGMVVGLLGILKAGGAYVPLDPGFPSERIAFMLEDAKAPVLVTQQYLTTQLPKHGAKVVCLDTDKMVLEQQSETNLLPTATSTNLAYVIYTSGSTGRPKGVQIIHRAVVNFLLSMREQPGLWEEDTLLAITTLSFDIAALELFLPLVVGARVIVAGRDVVADGTALMETLTRTRTTVMQATPVTWRILLAAGWQGNRHLKILCGGEALPLELAQQLLPKAASLWNLYGPTETTIWSSVREIEPGEESISIGRPIANTQIHLLDAHLQPVPVGVPGELYIGGDGLARGYLNRPELTAERFIPHPFSDEPGACLYRTGDLARYCSDGSIEHLGRIDFQVKIRGFRIELGEIEAVLNQHPAVRQAVVVARENVPGDKRLVAYVALHKDQAAMVDDLKSHLMKQVPAYMVPSAFMLLKTLPLTPNGKVDRRALPPPETSAHAGEYRYVAPTSQMQYQLVRIWEELFQVRPIGIKDDFFALGGHSLLAARMVNQVEQVCGKKLPLATLFAGATIEHLATVLMRQTPEPTPLVRLTAVQAAGSRRPFFYVHGDWKGGSLYCLKLAHYLGAEQPFYVLDPYRFDHMRVLPTFEAMVAEYVEALRAVQPEGPYLLGGFCNGGLIVYEMARQLHAQGHQVEQLVLIDPMDPAPESRAYKLVCQLGKLLRLNQQKQTDMFLLSRHLWLSWMHIRGKFELEDSYEPIEHWQKSESAGGLWKRLRELIPPAEALHQNWNLLCDWVALGYKAGTYSGKIVILWADKAFLMPKKWQKITQKNTIMFQRIPGTHLTCRTTYLDELAKQIRACISEAQEG